MKYICSVTKLVNSFNGLVTVTLQKCFWSFSSSNNPLGETVLSRVTQNHFTIHCTLDGEEKTYGGCEGPDAMYVKLISSDGHEFIVKREHALTSGTIKAMLSGPGQFAKTKTNEVNFHVLSKVCM